MGNVSVSSSDEMQTQFASVKQGSDMLAITPQDDPHAVSTLLLQKLLHGD